MFATADIQFKRVPNGVKQIRLVETGEHLQDQSLDEEYLFALETSVSRCTVSIRIIDTEVPIVIDLVPV